MKELFELEETFKDHPSAPSTTPGASQHLVPAPAASSESGGGVSKPGPLAWSGSALSIPELQNQGQL